MVAGHDEVMATFNPGDRVTARIGEDSHGLREETGTVSGPHLGNDGDGLHNGEPVVELTTDSGLELWAYERNVRLVKPLRPLVGPSPTASAPKIQAPFQAGFVNTVVYDDEGATVLEIRKDVLLGKGLTDEDVRLFGNWVADALNARVQRESAA